MGGCGFDSSGAEYGPVAGYYEHGREPSDSIKCETFETSNVSVPRTFVSLWRRDAERPEYVYGRSVKYYPTFSLSVTLRIPSKCLYHFANEPICSRYSVSLQVIPFLHQLHTSCDLLKL